MKMLRNMLLFARGLPKTLVFNLRYFPLRTAIRLPVLVSHRVWLSRLGGEIRLADARTGAVRIGFGDIGIFDRQRSRTIWQVTGKVDFRGRARINHGCKISVTGTLVVGDDVTIVAESSIVAQRHVQIGDRTLISWDVLIMDSDMHPLYDAGGRLVNGPVPVFIGDAVWIGCRSLVLKGVEIADGVVVAAATTLTRSVTSPKVVAGGHPARVLRENVSWSPEGIAEDGTR